MPEIQPLDTDMGERVATRDEDWCVEVAEDSLVRFAWAVHSVDEVDRVGTLSQCCFQV